jgi:hypothetical protein
MKILKSKKAKIDFINQMHRFINGENHGHGGSWWYPSENTRAYKVKVYGGYPFGASDLVRYMSPMQLGYYDERDIENMIQDSYDSELEWARDELVADLKALSTHILGVRFAGRSGGWIEVTYRNCMDDVDEETDIDVINDSYKEAMEFDKLEGEVENLIKDRHAELCKGLKACDGEEFVRRVFIDDEMIREIYANNIKRLADKMTLK